MIESHCSISSLFWNLEVFAIIQDCDNEGFHQRIWHIALFLFWVRFWINSIGILGKDAYIFPISSVVIKFLYFPLCFLTLYEHLKICFFYDFSSVRFLWLWLTHHWSHWLTAIQYLPISRQTREARFVPRTETVAVISIYSILFFQIEGNFTSTKSE